jgi:hypothetical protein
VGVGQFALKITFFIQFDAFPASEYDEVFLGYQPGKVVQLLNIQQP